MLGREINLALDFMAGQPSSAMSEQCYVQYVEWVKKVTQHSYAIAHEHSKKAALRQKRNYDKRVSLNKMQGWHFPNNPKNTLPTVKHGGGSLVFWGSFSPSGPGSLVKVDGIMKKEQYLKIIQENIRQDAEKLHLGSEWMLQQDNDPKHIAKIVKKWLQDNQINVLELPSQSPNLNPIENLWHKLKTQVKQRNPRNLRNLEEF